MTNMDFSQSLLFAAPESTGQQLDSSAQMDFSQSILFNPVESNDPHTPSQSEDTNKDTDSTKTTGDPPKGTKEARLLDGSTITLRPRQRRKVSHIFDDDEGIMNMDKLYERVEQRQQLRKSSRTVEKNKDNSKHDSAKMVSSKHDSSKHNKNTECSLMWADKYRPKTYFQVCHSGNESQYRMVMHWLKKWDAVVFGREIMKDVFVDHLGRPLKKVLLVHGPPGIGKTAISHLLAKQMGYYVDELNAANSMDVMSGVEKSQGASRFANATSALKLKIKNALTVNTISAKGKPTCLVIDEIDSAINAGDIVKVISDIISQDQQSSKAHEDPKKKKSGKGKRFVLNRPIICIANDIYPSGSRHGGINPMEKLRPMCEIVPFRKPSSAGEDKKINVSAQASVKELLSKISEMENLDLDRTKIAEVFEICDGDIRACINYLQFSCRKLDSDLHFFSKEDKNGTFANKDASMTWLSLVNLIFRRDQRLSKEENFNELLDVVSTGDGKSAASGSLDKVVRGCFNKYLDVVHVQDDSVVRPAEMSDWLFYYDSLASKGDSSFYPTLAALKFWSLFSDINSSKFRNLESLIPNAKDLDFSTFEQAKQNKAVMKKIADSIPTETRVSYCGPTSNAEFLACQFIPFLDKMLSPEVGSSQMKTALKPHELKQIESLTSLVRKFDLKLETQRDLETGESYLVFGPDWDSITMFIGQEKAEQKRKVVNHKRQWLFPLIQMGLDEIIGTMVTKKRVAEVDREENPKQKKNRLVSSVDFFKNQYDGIANKIETAPVSLNREATRIWVKHHEGFSNAVRKNIGWHDLWDL